MNRSDVDITRIGRLSLSMWRTTPTGGCRAVTYCF